MSEHEAGFNGNGAACVTRWWWIRHAPVIGGNGRLYGCEDLDCDVSDAQRFAELAGRLPDVPLWFVTPLSRTRKTLRAIHAATDCNAEAESVEAFLEQHFGDWQGLRWSEMEDRDPAAYAAFWQNPSGNAPPHGESFSDVMARVAVAVDRITGRYVGRDIVCVAHGGSIRAALAHALELHHERALSMVIETLSITRIDHIQGGGLHGHGKPWRVVGVNT